MSDRSSNSMSPIPIAAARRIAEDYGYDQVVIVARRVGEAPEHGEHCTTYGVDKANCDVAARIGDFFKHELMKWPRPAAETKAPQTHATEPSAYLKLWDQNGPRCRVDLTDICEPWLDALKPIITPLYARLPSKTKEDPGS